MQEEPCVCGKGACEDRARVVQAPEVDSVAALADLMSPAAVLSPPHTPRAHPTTPRSHADKAVDAEEEPCETCAVCLSPLASSRDGETVARRGVHITVCNHTFHRDCLVRCRVQRLDKPSLPCPLCRCTLGAEGLTPSPAERRAITQSVLFRGDMVQRCRLAREAVSQRWLRDRSAAAAEGTRT
jgi:Ring finger domain